MIHFNQVETHFVAIIAIFNQPETVAQTKGSTEARVTIEFTIPGHGDTLICINREAFLTLIDRAQSKQVESVPHLEQWMREKGIPFLSLPEWKMTLTFTSKLPDGTTEMNEADLGVDSCDLPESYRGNK
jgi:hypothetical protein